MTRSITLTFLPLVLATLAGCGTTDPEPPATPVEYGWTGTIAAGSPLADADTLSDSVTYSLFAVLDLDNMRQIDGILTIDGSDSLLTIGDDTLAYNPYEVVVSGFITARDTLGNPAAVLAEFDWYDGARCRLDGEFVDVVDTLVIDTLEIVDTVAAWDAEMGCGGEYVDSIQLLPFENGYVRGAVTRGEDGAQGARVWYCEMNEEETEIVSCTGAGYSGIGGAYRIEVPEGRWFVTFSIWDPIWDRWDHCREDLDRDGPRLGKKVTVYKARTEEASVECPWFF